MLGAIARHLRATGAGCDAAPARSTAGRQDACLVTCASTQQVVEQAGPGRSTASTDSELKLLTDEQMQTFIGQGYLTLTIDELGKDFHESLYEHARVEFAPKNNGLTGTGMSRSRTPMPLPLIHFHGMRFVHS